MPEQKEFNADNARLHLEILHNKLHRRETKLKALTILAGEEELARKEYENRLPANPVEAVEKYEPMCDLEETALRTEGLKKELDEIEIEISKYEDAVLKMTRL